MENLSLPDQYVKLPHEKLSLYHLIYQKSTHWRIKGLGLQPEFQLQKIRCDLLSFLLLVYWENSTVWVSGNPAMSRSWKKFHFLIHNVVYVNPNYLTCNVRQPSIKLSISSPEIATRIKFPYRALEYLKISAERLVTGLPCVSQWQSPALTGIHTCEPTEDLRNEKGRCCSLWVYHLTGKTCLVSMVCETHQRAERSRQERIYVEIWRQSESGRIPREEG